MLRTLLIALTLFASAQPAHAQRAERFDVIATEAYRAELDGPGDGEKRAIYFWRPSNAPAGPLPVLYVADGIAGLELMGARLRPHILAARAQPIVIVATDPHPRRRTPEYVPARRGDNPTFDRHVRWYVDVVLPWAERYAGASNDPAQRAIGGVSNGADFSIAIASRHPELFTRVIAHSAANNPPDGFVPPQNARWVLTAGINEGGPFPAIAARIGEAIGAQPIRHCLGPWRHDARSWREVSPGSIAWALGVGDADALQTDTERQHCINGESWDAIANARR